MRLALVASCIVALVSAAPAPKPQGYVIPGPGRARSSFTHGKAQLVNTGGRRLPILVERDDDGDISIETDVRSFAAVSRTGSGLQQQFTVQVDDSGESDEFFSRVCPPGQLPHGNRCVVPRINRSIFVFGRNEDSEESSESKSIDVAALPPPTLDYNIIFVRSRPQKSRTPIVVPPPQKKTVVYVLEDEKESEEDIVEVPSYPEIDPEVYYVKVRDGENPTLPGGIDLQSAYSQAVGANESPEDISFESDIKLTVGGGGGAAGTVGVGLPTQPAVGAEGGFIGSTSTGTDFRDQFDFNLNSATGVPLPATSGASADPGFTGAAAGFGGADAGFGGADSGFGAADSGFGDADSGFGGADAGFGGAGFNSDVGVSLPTTADSATGGFDSGFQSDLGFPADSFNSDTGSFNDGFSSTDSFNNNFLARARSLSTQQDSAVRAARRFRLPTRA